MDRVVSGLFTGCSTIGSNNLDIGSNKGFGAGAPQHKQSPRRFVGKPERPEKLNELPSENLPTLIRKYGTIRGLRGRERCEAGTG